MVTDHDTYHTMIEGFGFLMPGEVEVFDVDELEAAKDWVAA